MKKFAHILANENDEKFILKLLEELFTKDELAMIEQRLKIAQLIKQKIPQHTIAKQIKASLCSITRGSKMLKLDDSALGQIVDKYFLNDK